PAVPAPRRRTGSPDAGGHRHRRSVHRRLGHPRAEGSRRGSEIQAALARGSRRRRPVARPGPPPAAQLAPSADSVKIVGMKKALFISVVLGAAVGAGLWNVSASATAAQQQSLTAKFGPHKQANLPPLPNFAER